MDGAPDDRALSAFLRLLSARLPGAAFAVYAVAERRIRLAAATGGFARAAADAAPDVWRPLDPRLAPILANAACATIEPAALALTARFGALQPLRGPAGAVVGFLVVTDTRPRRLGRGLAAALADAAEVARPLLAAASLRAPPRAGAVRPGGGVADGADRPPRAASMQADAALRRAAQTGRNRFGAPRRAAAPPPDDRLALDLAEASARGQMRLAYQGYVALADGRLSGVEALLRWRHPSRGELAPATFIPLAEATGLILPLGAWALRTALTAAARWPGRLTLAVNVSALQFHQPGFVAEIEAALAFAGVAPERLELEITETVLMRDNPETKAQLDALIARGIRIALDDFGTGYSALAYLGRLPHHRIKLDRAFVQDLGNPATLELVRAILALAHRSGVAVTAEGVERPDQLRLVRALGFTHAQGFLTGLPVEDVATLLAEPLVAI